MSKSRKSVERTIAMLAMHYQIPLAGPDAVASVRARAIERGPLFDGMAGLAHKLFLVDPIAPCYATFYLWRDPDAALGFLEGPFFGALSQSFGRPDVRLLLTRATDLPFAAGDEIALATSAAEADEPELVRALDPKNSHILTLGRGLHGRRFEVLYHAVGMPAP
jgi:hypothetical protein